MDKVLGMQNSDHSLEEKGSGEVALIETKEASNEPLIHRLARTMWAIKAVYEVEPGLTLLPIMILSRLVQEDGLTQNNLTGTLRVDPSIITRVVKQMEHEYGWIRRRRDPQDNRLMRVYLTDKGREQSQSLDEKVTNLERRLTRCLSATQLEALYQMLASLEESARSDGDPQK